MDAICNEALYFPYDIHTSYFRMFKWFTFFYALELDRCTVHGVFVPMVD